MEKEKPKCVVTGEPAVSRGLCARCYQAASSLVKSGKVTWEELEARGLALPSTRADAGPNPFLEAYNQSEPVNSEALPWNQG